MFIGIIWCCGSLRGGWSEKLVFGDGGGGGVKVGFIWKGKERS
jgi:hypothetical protein